MKRHQQKDWPGLKQSEGAIHRELAFVGKQLQRLLAKTSPTPAEAGSIRYHRAREADLRLGLKALRSYAMADVPEAGQ